LAFVTLRDILAGCREEGWAVPAFDVINMETAQAAVAGAEAERAPVILMVLPSHTPIVHWPVLVDLIKGEADRHDVPVCLLLDHAVEMAQIRAALGLGFSAVMIDGSTLPLAENTALTRQAVEMAHAQGASVEAELGHVGYGEEVLDDTEAASRLTRVEEARRFVADTGVDALAVAIGTVHGLYRGEPRLDFERLRALHEALPVPLVVHGGSGTPDADVKRLVANGICKINIWTEVAIAFGGALKETLTVPAQRYRLPEALALARERAQTVMQEKIRLLGASGRA